MANPPPPNHAADHPEDELVHPEPAPVILFNLLLYPEEDPKEESEEEQEPEPELEPTFAPFSQAAQNNMNGWLEEEDDEDEMEVEEDDEMDVEIDDNVDDAEIIHPFEDTDPLNRPPPDSDTKPEAVAAAPAGHATLQPLPPLRRFSSTFYISERSSATPFNADICKVSAPGPLGKNLDTLHSKVKTLARKMKDRSDNEFKIQKKFKSSYLRMNSFDYDLSTLDSTLREQILKNSKKIIMTLKKINQAAIKKLIADKVAVTIAQDRATRGNTSRAGGPGGSVDGQSEAPHVRECSFTGFMKCNPATFHGNEEVVELCRWFKKTISVFRD
uniref:Reverse transcriptase domain-containing protein n=1 Tax=Tanacetum cinerariifolium TaxID=118510 RepID=A0A6L2KYR5_TANCI|nr:hypothetical protein [Tanacetum cinerariifolium]